MEVRALDRPAERRRWSPVTDGRTASPLAVATLDTAPDRSHRRWSFSAITDQATAGSDPFDATLADAGAGDEHGEVAGAPPAPTEARADRGGLLARLPAGTGFGTLVHRVLDGLDFAAADLEGEVAAAVDRELAARPFDLDQAGGTVGEGRSLLVDGLCAALTTPLGDGFGGVRLADLASRDRLCELVFDLRLGEGGRPPLLGSIGELVAADLRGDTLREWALETSTRRDLELAGQLTGSIDLVLRIQRRSGEPSFVVADYKTNLLTPRGVAPGPGDYGPSALAAAMVEHDYPLQALLYSVALHRYLRWTLAGYDPEVHLGGVAYLFLRGMTGSDVATTDGRPDGVFGWELPARLVVELSDLLDGRTAGTR